MTWTVSVLKPAEDGVRAICPEKADDILATVRSQLSAHAEDYQADRWPNCPDDYFTYGHVIIAGGHWHQLVFVVKDSKGPGLLDVVWVEDHPGAEVG